MSQNVPIPAESLRDLADGAENSIPEMRENGYTATARRTETAIAQARDLSSGKDGEFVSFDATYLAGLVADAHGDSTHVHVGRHFLEQYDVW